MRRLDKLYTTNFATPTLTVRRKRHIRIQRLAGAKRPVHAQVVITARRLLLDAFLVAILAGTAVLVAVLILSAAAAAAALLGLALDLLHFGPLILEPHLHHAHAQPGVFGQCLAHFAARLRRQLKRRLELTALRRCENRTRSLRTASAVARSQRVAVQHQIVVHAAGARSTHDAAATVAAATRHGHVAMLQLLLLLLLLGQVQVLLEVVPTEELTGAQNKLLAFLQGLTAHAAHEAGQVEDETLCPHDHVVGLDAIAAARAFHAEESV